MSNETSEQNTSLGLAFVLVADTAEVAPVAVVEAGESLGIHMTFAADSGGGSEKDDGPGVLTFDVEGGVSLMVMQINVPHPDVPQMFFGPTSPDRDEAIAAPAHIIVTVLGLTGDQQTRDAMTARLAAAVVAATPAVGAMLSHNMTFHHAGFFKEIVQETQADELPVEVCVDITIAREDEKRLSFLTHGLLRYGREEFYITSPTDSEGAMDFVYMMAHWMVSDPDKELPTGDTVGRSEDEKLLIQRVPNPTGEGPQVIKLDLE